MPARGWAWCAFVLGLGHASVSAYWALGGTFGLATAGGELAGLSRDRAPGVVAVLGAVVGLQLFTASLGLVVTGDRERNLGLRALVLAAAVVLILYGGVLTAGQALLAAGVIPASPDLDRTAFYGHLFLWDPWFLLWGVALWMAVRGSGR